MQDSPRELHETLVNIRQFRVITAGRYSAAKGMDFPPHYHQGLEFIVFESGQVECFIAAGAATVRSVDAHLQTFEVDLSQSQHSGQVWQMRPGSILVMPPMLIHADRSLTAYSHFYLILDLGDVAAPDKPLLLQDDPERTIEKKLKTIAQEWLGNQPKREQLLEVLLEQLAIYLERSAKNPIISSAEQVVRRAERYMAELIAEPPPIAKVAEHLNVSTSALRAYFAELRDYSPKEYQQRLRVNRALEMIRSSSLSLEEIAWMTGFDSASHLSRYVKSSIGLTPGQYRADVAGKA